MRHNKKYNSLGRKSQHRKLMLSNLACSLIKYKRISTTVAKAKALRIFFEPIVTKAKVDNTANRREAFAKLRDKEAVKELFHDVITKVGDRQGGYTRILKTGTRVGDSAEMCIMELVDFNTTYTQESGAAQQKSSTRRRRAPKKKADEVVADAVEVKEEAAAPAEENKAE